MNKRVVSFSDGRTEAVTILGGLHSQSLLTQKKKKSMRLHIGYTRVNCVQRSPCQSFQILPERAVWRENIIQQKAAAGILRCSRAGEGLSDHLDGRETYA